MEKLVLSLTTDDGVNAWQHDIPFEYSSKDDFCLMILKKADEGDYRDLFDIFVPKRVFLEIEHYVFTLEEWFEEKKEKI